MNRLSKCFAAQGSRVVPLLLLTLALTAIDMPKSYGRSDTNSLDRSLPTHLPVLEIFYPNRSAGEVTFSSGESDTLINTLITSNTVGIGSATISLAQGEWPESIAVRLYLRGLEGFSATNGTTTIDRHQLTVQAFDQNMTPSDQQYLMEDAGYYEVCLPRSLFTEGTTDIRIQWVDFYRQ